MRTRSWTSPKVPTSPRPLSTMHTGPSMGGHGSLRTGGGLQGLLRCNLRPLHVHSCSEIISEDGHCRLYHLLEATSGREEKLKVISACCLGSLPCLCYTLRVRHPSVQDTPGLWVHRWGVDGSASGASCEGLIDLCERYCALLLTCSRLVFSLTTQLAGEVADQVSTETDDVVP